MPCRATNALVRRVVVLALGAAALTIVTPPTPWNGGSAAWSDTRRISDGAVATAPDQVPIGGIITVQGQNWTTSTGAGSLIAVKLDDGDVDRRTPVTNPATGDPIADSSVVAAVLASSDGSFTIAVPVPEDTGWDAGSRHTIRLLTGQLLSDDAIRSVALTFDLVSDTATAPGPTPSSSESHGRALEPGPGVASGTAAAPHGTTSASSDATSSTAPRTSAESTAGRSAEVTLARQRASGMREHSGQASPDPTAANRSRASKKPTARAEADSCPDQASVAITSSTSIKGVPVATFGGVLRVAGSGFCQRRGGGSAISVQIDDGALRRLDDTVNADRTIWQIIRAEDDGTFRAVIRLPDLHPTDPAFADGSPRLRLQTGRLGSGDTVRSVRTGEFVVLQGTNTGILPEPAGTPPPVDPVRALVGERGGAVTAAQTGEAVRVVVPDAEPGDWLFAYAFRGTAAPDPQAFPATWLQVDADRSVTFDLAGFVDAAATDSRITLQARDGTLVGWAQIADNGTAATDPTPAPTDLATSSDPQTSAGPRSLVVFSAGSLLLLGLVALAVAREQRRRALRDLNAR